MPESDGASPDRAASSPTWHRSLIRIALLPATVVGLVAAGLFWPSRPCSDPVCAKLRFSIAVEIDAFEGATRPPLSVMTSEGMQSAQAVLATGGIDARFVLDQTTLPYDVSQGWLDRADLHQFFQAWRSVEVTGRPDASLYALVTAAGIVADNGEPLFGLMFDDNGREAIAVAPSETRAAFQNREPTSVGMLQMRTFLHELLHALNRSHLDAAQLPAGRLTLEAPTKCISNAIRGAWSLKESPLFALSPATIRFFQTGARADVLPGNASTPYDLQRSSATECEHARMNTVAEPASTRWALLRKRFSPRLLSTAMAAAPSAADMEPSELTLRVQLQPATYPLGYPVAVRLSVINHGEHSVPVKGRLAPAFGIVRIDTRAPDESEWETLIPLVWFEPASDEEAMLEPGASTEQTVPIYFGDGGWTFPAPGNYEVRARLILGDANEQAISEAVRLSVEGARTSGDAAVYEGLLDEQDRLDRDVGRELSFGGRGGSPGELDRIRMLAEKYPGTAIATTLNLTLASQKLRPPLDPLTGIRPMPDVAGAAELLADSCTDSGVSALKQQLLRRFQESQVPDERSLSPQNEADAWDGTTRSLATRVATYSDPTLRQVGASMHFCLDDDQLRGAALSEARRLSRQLRKRQAGRIVVVGHADHSATCRYNDALAMRRAEALKRVMVASGIPAKQVTAVSLGKRRPLDFAATADAGNLNRRVEVLAELPAPPETTESQGVVLPACDAS